MTGLVFKKVWILSKVQKAARIVSLSPGTNVLIGENDVGKSTFLKSLYHTLGADAPQMDNRRWKQAKPIYCVECLIEGTPYFVVRDGKYFGVFDAHKKLISKHVGISGETGIANSICELLGFRLDLERSNNGTLGRAGPSFYFLPFYVDQDEGWNSSWSSFNGLQQFSGYRSQMLDYHLGIKPQSYFDTRKLWLEETEQLGLKSDERVTLAVALVSLQKRSANLQINFDPDTFRAELEELVDEFNFVRAKRQDALDEVKSIRNDRNSVELDILILRRAIDEIESDYTFAAATEQPEVVPCPTCGTEFDNSFQARFGLLDDVSFCQSTLDQKLKDYIELGRKLQISEKHYRSISEEEETFSSLLERKKSSVSLHEVVAAEGAREMTRAIQGDISELDVSISAIKDRVSDLKKLLKVNSEKKQVIVEFYQRKMKEYLNSLNVMVLEEADYADPVRIIKTNALGSDLPRSLLAQYFALLHTTGAFGSTKICPMVIDSPQQQEPDKANINAIFAFIFSKTLPQQQLIVGTKSLEDVLPESLPKTRHEILFDVKYHLLQEEMYDQALQDVAGMHNEMLSE
jgi:hypothetical protein